MKAPNILAVLLLAACDPKAGVDTSACGSDADGDGSCTEVDCDDADPSVSPEAAEVAYDGVDNDCDPLTLDDDLDGDGWPLDQDCDDTDPALAPDASERCNGIDDDCDGLTDDADDDIIDASTWYLDVDGDGYGGAYDTVTACQMPDGATAEASDCDDDEAEIYPGAPDTDADGVDSDCDGAERCYVDLDGDGYRGDREDLIDSLDSDCGDAGEATASTPAGDCDDADATISPAATETWYDGVDQDCDGADDDDQDGDGHTAESRGGDDCDDEDADVHPGATEVGCDLIDHNCDGADVDYAGDAHWRAVRPTGSEWEGRYTTLSSAISASVDGDEICVAPGTYTEQVDLDDRDITVIGAGGSGWTTLDGGGVGPVVSMSGVNVSLEGFTITNGLDSTAGGGVYVYGGAVALTDLVLTGNGAHEGGGLYLGYTAATVTDLTISDNEADSVGGGLFATGEGGLSATGLVVSDNSAGHSGGGIYAERGYSLELTDASLLENSAPVSCGAICIGTGGATLTDVRVWGNSASGGALYASGSDVVATHLDVRANTTGQAAFWFTGTGSLTLTNAIFACNAGTVSTALDFSAESLFLTNATFVDNTGYDSAVQISATSATVRNITVAYNTATDSGEGALWVNDGTDLSLSYSHAYGNSPTDYSGIDDPTGSDGCITDDPGFVDISSDDCTAWDLSLDPSASPLVNAGDPSIVDADGSRSDIGAYGGPEGESWPTSWPE